MGLPNCLPATSSASPIDLVYLVLSRTQARARGVAVALALAGVPALAGAPNAVPASDSSGARTAAASFSEFGRIEIPALRVRARVAEGTDPRTLEHAVGRISGTAFPGDDGNVGLAAHRDSFFKDFSTLQFGDRIRLTTADGAFVYAVESFELVEPKRVDVLDPVGYPALTMVTCYPRWWAGPAPWRLVVRAREVGRVAAGRHR